MEREVLPWQAAPPKHQEFSVSEKMTAGFPKVWEEKKQKWSHFRATNHSVFQKREKNGWLHSAYGLLKGIWKD
jgi:hypothetical protein